MDGRACGSGSGFPETDSRRSVLLRLISQKRRIHPRCFPSNTYQGQNGLFFAGGWTTWFDSQEAALLSAMDIAGTLSSPAAASAPLQPAVAFDCTALPVRVKAWLEMVLSRKRERHTNKLVELIARLP